MTEEITPSVKRASWIELYFDLVFVLAVAQVAHAVAAEPTAEDVWQALGTFAVLWWTWVGFAVFYNRYGDADSLPQRLFIIAATVPCGLAAVAVHDLVHGHRAAFALSLAGARAMLALAHFVIGGKLPLRIGIGYVLSATGLAVSVFLPAPAWWIVWAVVLAVESIQLFYGEDKRHKVSRAELRNARRDWNEGRNLHWLIPSDRIYALDAHHLAERFGLFIIILLGEVVASSGQGMLAATEQPPQVWTALAGSIALAGALWWLYFDTAAELNRKMLETAGGSPVMARTIFAVGHMIPAFALILVAAGVRLLLQGSPAEAAFWLVAAGIGIYLVGTRVLLAAKNRKAANVFRLFLIVLTFQLGRLHELVTPPIFIWICVVWVIVCALFAMRPRQIHEPEPQQVS